MPTLARGQAADTALMPDMAQSILFSNDPELLAREAARIYNPGDVKLRCFNNNVPMQAEEHTPARPQTACRMP